MDTDSTSNDITPHFLFLYIVYSSLHKRITYINASFLFFSCEFWISGLFRDKSKAMLSNTMWFQSVVEFEIWWKWMTMNATCEESAGTRAHAFGFCVWNKWKVSHSCNKLVTHHTLTCMTPCEIHSEELRQWESLRRHTQQEHCRLCCVVLGVTSGNTSFYRSAPTVGMLIM